MSGQREIIGSIQSQAESDEMQLIALMSLRRTETAADRVSQVEREIVDHIERHLRGDLRRILQSRTRTGLDSSSGSTQFTDLLQTFYGRILKGFPEGMVRIETRSSLLAYIAQALRRLLFDRFEDRERRNGMIEQFAMIRQKELNRDCPDVSLDQMLQRIDAWTAGSDEQQVWAKALQLYYLIGMTQEEVGVELGISTSTAERRITSALAALRKETE